MLTAFLTAAAVLFLAASFALVIVWHEPEVAWLSSGMASVCVLLADFASHSKAIRARLTARMRRGAVRPEPSPSPR